MRDPLQLLGADGTIASVERQRDDGHVVDALGLDQRRAYAQATRQPVGVGVDGVVQAHKRFGARETDLELHRQHGQSRL